MSAPASRGEGRGARFASWCAAALLMVAVAAGCTTAPRAGDATASPTDAGGGRDAAALRVMAFNVRVPVDTDDDRWENRRDLLAQTIRDANADIVGTQELVPLQRDFVLAQVPGYEAFGRGRSGDPGKADDESGAVFWRPATLRLVDSGDFWLSDTPDVPGSITWGNLLPRMVTWGLFERRADGSRFYLVNTHFPYRDEDGPRREKAAGLILSWIDAHAGDLPVVVLGDFNDVPGSGTHRRLVDTLADAWTAAPVRAGPAGTFHDFTGKADKRIDWVLVRGFRVLRAETVARHAGDRYPSDHFPVMVDLE